MSDRRNEVQVGLFAVIAVLLLAMLILVFGGFRNFVVHTYTITATFPDAAGTTEGTPVRLLGIEIGKVAKVALAPGDSGVVMTLKIQKNAHIRSDAPLAIKQEGFIANLYLEFGSGTGEQFLPTDGTAKTAGRIDTFAAYFEKASSAVADMGGEIKKRVADISTKFGTLVDNLNSVTGDKEFTGSLRESAKKLPELITNLASASKKADSSLDKAQALIDELRQTNSAVRVDADKVSGSFADAATNLSHLTANLNDVAVAVKSGQGTVGKLVTDDELYRSTVSLIEMISQAAEQFKDLADTVKRHPDWLIKGPPEEKK